MLERERPEGCAGCAGAGAAVLGAIYHLPAAALYLGLVLRHQAAAAAEGTPRGRGGC